MSIKPKTASFQTHGRLLQELGERLVARADVALTELIKNAYDADADKCSVRLSGNTLIVEDTGHGMTESEFLNRWMEIATPDKQRHRKSTRYNRSVTGSKGIGRFAVRFLGLKLKLETVAESGKMQNKTKLVITFDWPKIDKQEQLQNVKIPYVVEPVGSDVPTGTRLTISRLRNPEEIQITKELRTNLLSVAHPYAGLENGGFSRGGQTGGDPGFRITLPDDETDEGVDLSTEILRHAFARLTITRRKTVTHFVICNKDGKVLLDRRISGKSRISNGFFADIRYFPRRSGMFVGTNVDGRVAWGWIQDNKNNGIGVVDHGFRVRPYGFGEDDWLQLSYDAGHRRRKWRSSIMATQFAMPRAASSDAKLNPMLYLPSFHQLVGAVFVESVPGDKASSFDDLTPSMDREGFVENDAFKELRDQVRTGLEMLAHVDHKQQRKAQEKKRKAEAQALRRDLVSAVEFIETVPGLAKTDRNAVVKRFQQLSKELDDTEEYFRVGTQKLEMMGLLGVMAGFVTHEMQRILHDLEKLLRITKRLERRDRSVKPIRKCIQSSLETVAGQLEYSTAFVGAVHDSQAKPGPYTARGAAELVVKQFTSFVTERGIAVELEIKRGLRAPPVPKALYNGVAMNLFTNALKAAVGGTGAAKQPRVVIKSWNEKLEHVFEVADSGVGIPPSIEKRIWDPLFTTTSATDFNPLGSGMGLGLTLVRQLVSEVKGKVQLVDPPPGFTTCFRVTYPMSTR
jgi:signal transduction histidine kinase